MSRTKEIFSAEGRKQALREFADKAKRFFVADLSDEELDALACDLRSDIEDVYKARGGDTPPESFQKGARMTGDDKELVIAYLEAVSTFVRKSEADDAIDYYMGVNAGGDKEYFLEEDEHGELKVAGCSHKDRCCVASLHAEILIAELLVNDL